MIFVDIATVQVRAGKGGDGMISFRREPFVDRGGPDGGNGGHGGSVVCVADRNINTLSKFRQRQLLQAEDGGNGARARRHGKKGEDLKIAVPVGTVITNQEGDIVADLKDDKDEAVVARGGEGGFGNAHFTSSTRQAPNFAEKGEFGDEDELTFELKMIADVGLVGLPNAGKSTLLSVVSNARPEIASYPFTTLTPNLGVADVGKESLLIADIPGLIEGASEGRGLGDDFLRHVERTATLIHLIDAYSNDIAKDYQTIMDELAAYKVDLTERPMIIALTKTENMDQDILNLQLSELQAAAGAIEVFPISSMAKQGIDTLLQAARHQVEHYRQAEAEAAASSTDDSIVITLDPSTGPAWLVEPQADGSVRVHSAKLERFARRTDFQNDQAVTRLRDIMYKMGIERELKRLEIEPESLIYIGKSDSYRIMY